MATRTQTPHSCAWYQHPASPACSPPVPALVLFSCPLFCDIFLIWPLQVRRWNMYMFLFCIHSLMFIKRRGQGSLNIFPYRARTSTCWESTPTCMLYKWNKKETNKPHPLFSQANDTTNVDNTYPLFWYSLVYLCCRPVHVTPIWEARCSGVVWGDHLRNGQGDSQLREGSHQGPTGRASFHPEKDFHKMGQRLFGKGEITGR